MKMILDKFSSPLVRSNPKIVKTVSRILPFLTYGQPKIIETLVHYFLKLSNFEQHDQLSGSSSSDSEVASQALHMQCFAHVCESIKVKDENGDKLKNAILSSGIPKLLVDYLKARLQEHLKNTNIPEDLAGLDISSDEYSNMFFESNTSRWATSLSKPSLPYVLTQLAGM
jgi:hypothetical protein